MSRAKSLAAAIVGGEAPSGASSSADAAPSKTGGGIHDDAGDLAAEAFLAAIKKGDPKAVHQAFHDLAETCYPQLGQDDDGEDDESGEGESEG